MSHSISVAILQVILPLSTGARHVLPPLWNYTGINDSSIVKIGVSPLVVPARASETAILLVPSLILPGAEK